MEDQILTAKRFDLEKLKENSLRIPVSFKVFNSRISVKVLSDMENLPIKIELILVDSLSDNGSNRITLLCDISEKDSVFFPKDIAAFEPNKNYMLIALKTDKKASVELSIYV